MLGVCLALALDASGSVKPPHWDALVRGHMEAFADPAMAGTINRAGGVAVTVRQFDDKTVRGIPWRELRTPGDVAVFAAELEAMPRHLGSGTNIPRAIRETLADFADAPECETHVIDIVTDGEDSTDASAQRDRAEEAGVRINVLMVGSFGEAELSRMRENVATRTTALARAGFLMTVESWDRFPPAIRAKLTLEIADAR